MKVVIIDDEIAMHLIMKKMLASFNDVVIVGSFQDTIEAFSFLRNNEVDLVFIDISMPWESGLDFAKRLREIGNQVKFVFVTSYKEYALSAFEVYAYDYIVKPLSQNRLKKTIERVLSENIAKHEDNVTESIPPLTEPLTKRELEILRSLSSGMSNKEIALMYELTEGTVKNHLVNIFGKLQVKNRLQATLIAKMHKLIN